MSGTERFDFGGQGGWQAAVTIPARNEEDRILACLDAAAAAVSGRGGIVLIVNGSSDATLRLARDWFARGDVPGLLLDHPEPPEGGVGWARRQAAQAALSRVAPDGMIATTDADSRVAPDWISANLAELRRADLICGLVEPDPEEGARLPEIIGRRGAVEGEYEALTRRAMALLDPVPHDPAPAHLNAAGASLAFRPALYRDVGGFPPLPSSEDRAFAVRAEARGWRVRHATAPRVITSCRMTGRVTGGMADALRSRTTEADPLVDGLFEPARATLLRARIRGQIRSACGHDPAAFAAAWLRAEAAEPLLARRRMRRSELQAELPALHAAVEALESATTPGMAAE